MKSLILIFGLLVSSFCFGADSQAQVEPRTVDENMIIKWMKKPIFRINNDELKGYDRYLVVRIETDVNGFVKVAEINKSSGLQDLDNKIIEVFKKAKIFAKYPNDKIENFPIRLTQPVELSVSRVPEYAEYPEFNFKNTDLKGSNRTITLSVEANEKGKLTKVKVSKSTGIPALDEYVLSEFFKKTSFKPLVINGKPQRISTTADFRFNLRSASD